MLETAMSVQREIHRRGVVDEQLAAEVGFLLEALDKEFVGTRVQFPVDAAGRLARVVQTVFRKFDRKAVERTLMQARDKSLDHLMGKEVEGLVFFNFSEHQRYF